MSTDVLSRIRAADPCPSPVAYDDTVAQNNIDAIVRADLTVRGTVVPQRRPHRRAWLAVAAVAVLLGVAGTLVGLETTGDRAPLAGSGASGTSGPPASTSRPAPGATAPWPAGSGSAAFSWNGVSFEYPAAWRSYRYDDVSTMSVLYTYLSTSPIPEPCATTTDAAGTVTTSCRTEIPDLRAGGVFVDWTSYGMPGHTIDSYPGTATTIAGRAARVVRGAVPDECASSGAVAGVRAAVDSAAQNVLTMTACVGAGEDVDADLAAVDRMLASLRIDR